jgi:hypothetical protein
MSSPVLEVDPSTREIVWKYVGEPILGFYSFMISGCERLANGNTFIAEGATGRLFEVTPEGETVWEFVSPWVLPSPYGPTSAVFRAYRIAENDPRLKGIALSAAQHSRLNGRIAANEVLGENDEKAKRPTRKPRANKQRAATRGV